MKIPKANKPENKNPFKQIQKGPVQPTPAPGLLGKLPIRKKIDLTQVRCAAGCKKLFPMPSDSSTLGTRAAGKHNGQTVVQHFVACPHCGAVYPTHYMTPALKSVLVDLQKVQGKIKALANGPRLTKDSDLAAVEEEAQQLGDREGKLKAKAAKMQAELKARFG